MAEAAAAAGAGVGTAAAGGESAAGESAQAQGIAQQGAEQAGKAAETTSAEMPSVLSTTETGEENDDALGFEDWVRKQFPDDKFEDDNQIKAKARTHIKELSDYRTKNRESNKKVVAMLHAHPELVDVMQDLDAGADMRVALARHFDPADLVPQQGDPDYDAWGKAKTERETKFSERQKWQKSYETNRKEASETLKQFATDMKMDEATVKDYATKVDAVLGDVYNGKLSRQFLDAMHKALMFDQAVAEAKDVGRVAGRNEQIETKIAKTEAAVGDGLPDLKKSGELQETKVPEGAEFIGGLVDGFNAKRQRFGTKQG